MTPEKLLENLYAIAYSLPEQERRFFCALEPAIDPNSRHENEKMRHLRQGVLHQPL